MDSLPIEDPQHGEGRCMKFPPNTNSHGIWDRTTPFVSTIPKLELQIFLMYTITQLFHLPLKRLGFPRLVSEIIAGIVLGPSMPRIVADQTGELFAKKNPDIISTVSLFGYMLFLFLIGVKTDAEMIFKTGKKAFAIGVLALVGPFIVGLGSAGLLVTKLIKKEADALFIISNLVLLVLVSSVFTHYIEQSALFGPFVIGLAVPAGPPLGSAIVYKFDSFVSGLLLPAYMSLISLRTDLHTLSVFHRFAIVNVLLNTITFLAKVGICMLPALYCRMHVKDALALGLIMSSKGVVQMATYSLLRDDEIINQQSMTLLVICTGFAVALVPLLVKGLYNPSRKYAGYQERNIMHSKSNSPLHIVACIHRPDNISGLINLFDASGPTTESPMTVYLLHLIVLQGRASPVFISHQIQKKTVSSRSYSQDVIAAFTKYGRKHKGGLVIQTFTAISPLNLMDEDICTLALDKLAALIVIPFHRKWAIDGSVESEDETLRTLNSKILDMAPCSIGVLVDRGRRKRATTMESSYSVAMLFFGGNDDREAIYYAKRVSRNPKISLTVVHCMPTDDDYLNEKEMKLDTMVLEEVKINANQRQNVYYMEVAVNDGTETSLLVRATLDEYDLVMVGRRYSVESSQTRGLEDWSEFPELGVVGDLLATSNQKGGASILVVQRQKQLIR